MICPDCNGTGIVIANHVSFADGRCEENVPMDCSRCYSSGTGIVSDETPAWIALGQRMRDARVHGSPYRSLHAEAKRRGLDTETLSRMERGVIRPIPDHA